MGRFTGWEGTAPAAMLVGVDGSTPEAGMRAWRGIVGGLLAVLLAGGCGIVPEPEEQARGDATDLVRAQAARFGTSLWGGLRAADAAGARRVVEQHEELLGSFQEAAGPWQDGVLAASVDEDGAVRLDLAFRDKADAGGGLSYAQAVVQLCVRMTGTPGPGGQVRLANLPCPASVASPGLVDQEVTLDEEGPPPAPRGRVPACHSGGDNDDCVGG
jgi:hypothetical protein